MASPFSLAAIDTQGSDYLLRGQATFDLLVRDGNDVIVQSRVHPEPDLFP